MSRTFATMEVDTKRVNSSALALLPSERRAATSTRTATTGTATQNVTPIGGLGGKRRAGAVWWLPKDAIVAASAVPLSGAAGYAASRAASKPPIGARTRAAS